jgi:hypothetical protein
MSADMEKAKAVLLEFMSAMRDWENKFATLYKRENAGPEAHNDEAKAELQPIYERYVTKKERKNGRLATGAARYPPESDPEAERIVAVEAPNDRRIIFEILWTHPKVATSTRRQRYIMINKDGAMARR